MMSIEQKINYQLNKYPAVKKVIKRAYQLSMYAVSKKIKSEGNITRISPDDASHEYFFGYYDKSPWDITDRYMLCLKANDTWSDVSPREKADILLIDTEKPESDANKVRKIAETNAWNVQQSCMLQWLGPDFSSHVLYNDYRDGKYVSVIITLATMKEKVIPAAVYSVSVDGKVALTLDFSRLYNLRPGYGYYNVPEITKDVALPDTTAIWKVDLETGEVSDVLKYTDFVNFRPRPEMQEVGTVHKVNHIMLSPNGKRFMVLYRWFNGERKYTRLITCNIDGTDMYILSDDDMVSHCFWKDDNHIIAFENKKESGTGYYLMTDKASEYYHCWPEMTGDGHPSYNSDCSCIVTDSYPDRARIQYLRVMKSECNKPEVVAKVFSPFKYDNDTRCDLHPRWNHAGDKVCFDSVFEGHRGLYVVPFPKSPKEKAGSKTEEMMTKETVEKKTPKYSIVTPMYNSFHLMERYFRSLEEQTLKDFEVILVDDCSTDDTYENACSYMTKSSLNFRVIRSEHNAGPGKARNIGMEIAMGEWITFIDSDDWIDMDLLEKINNVIENNDVGCVIYDYYISDGKNHKLARSMYRGERGIIPIRECIASVRNHTIGKVYKLANCLENGIRFPNLKRCEDVAFVCRAIDACGSVYYMKEPMYYYYQRSMSLSNDQKLDAEDMVSAFRILEETLGGKYPEELREKAIPDLLYGVLLMMCKSGKTDSEIIEYIDNYEKRYPEWWKRQSLQYLGRAKGAFLKAAKMRKLFLMKQYVKIHGLVIDGGRKKAAN